MKKIDKAMNYLALILIAALFPLCIWFAWDESGLAAKWTITVFVILVADLLFYWLLFIDEPSDELGN